MRRCFLLGLGMIVASWSPLNLHAQKGVTDRTARVPVADIAPADTEAAEESQTGKDKKKKKKADKVNAKKVIRKGIDWLIEAQHSSGGWGAGSHKRQDIRDPAAVKTDPATTAFAALALIKAGHTPVSGEHRDAVMSATKYLIEAVEKAEPKSDKITTLTGTQPQTKLGNMIDTSMTAQLLARVGELLPAGHPLSGRVEDALTECLRRIEATQNEDGSWKGGGGWAPVLQSAMNCSSLELAKGLGCPVSDEKLARARDYQKGNVNAATGGASPVAGGASAGVELYSFAGGLRGNAADASRAKRVIEEAKDEGKLPQTAKVTLENLEIAGQTEVQAQVLNEAAMQNDAQVRRLSDAKLLAGFGNNGGEEFLSYLMTSESLVIAGGEAWDKWNNKMKDRLGKIQNQDGSWSGHHCITSPVFCTAAVVQVLTTERDVDMLRRIAKASE